MTISSRLLRRASALVTALALLVAPAAAAGPGHDPGTTEIRLIGFNDFHGNLEPPAGSSGRVRLSDGTAVEAGGAAYLATHVRELRAQTPNSLLLSAGDNIGASPLASALFHDEPTIELFNQIGVDASAVGNHELDEGTASCSESSSAAVTRSTGASSAIPTGARSGRTSRPT
ncbi:hypothetical protein GCM10012275_31880 [Longimycelium tulufanense]|uniref:5'-nucleotidase n=1 Tax=Longimycelium tulufanense TaxID=907463 RepID=A0A8J3FVI9_9PSEU|nr:hypothetical protein GCM10012275_31880 [Longimycelium tulufanense]